MCVCVQWLPGFSRQWYGTQGESIISWSSRFKSSNIYHRKFYTWINSSKFIFRIFHPWLPSTRSIYGLKRFPLKRLHHIFAWAKNSAKECLLLLCISFSLSPFQFRLFTYMIQHCVSIFRSLSATSIWNANCNRINPLSRWSCIGFNAKAKESRRRSSFQISKISIVSLIAIEIQSSIMSSGKVIVRLTDDSTHSIKI